MKRKLLVFVIIGLLAVLFIQSSWLSERLYPIKYERLIKQNAVKYEVDPHMIASVIRVESNFRTGLESPKGALGLMQLMPPTAQWIIEKTNMKDVSEEQLRHDPEDNIELGTWYLKHLLDQFDQDKIVSLAAYNAGPGNVSKWLADGTWSGDFETVQDIPFGETRNYVQKVIYYYNKYKEIYPNL